MTKLQMFITGAMLGLCLASGCARYCSARPHYHQSAPEARSIPCTTDLDCETKNGREY